MLNYWKTLAVSLLLLFAVATVLVPSMCGCSKQASPESGAVANLRTINTAEVTFQASSGGRYGTLEELINAGLLDSTLRGVKGGYVFALTIGGDGEGYRAQTYPKSDKTGRWGYYSVPDAVVRYSTDPKFAPTGQTGLPVQ